MPTIEEESAIRIPAADIVRTPRYVYVTTEIPGPDCGTIEVTATERQLTIHASRSEGPHYRLELPLPDAVDPASARTTYRNGVLDITLIRNGVPTPHGGGSDAG